MCALLWRTSKSFVQSKKLSFGILLVQWSCPFRLQMRFWALSRKSSKDLGPLYWYCWFLWIVAFVRGGISGKAFAFPVVNKVKDCMYCKRKGALKQKRTPDGRGYYCFATYHIGIATTSTVQLLSSMLVAISLARRNCKVGSRRVGFCAPKVGAEVF